MPRAPYSLLLMAIVLVAWAPRPAAADDGSGGDDGSTLHLMGEPASYTDVIDAFDGDDPFDLNVTLGFDRSRTSGTIQRQTLDSMNGMSGGPPDYRATQHWADIANAVHVRNTLMLGLDAGLYHDLAAYARLPLILSDTRGLEGIPGAPDPRGLLTDTQGGAALFNVPFNSPTRSGIDQVRAGLAWEIFNQYRDPSTPTWMIMAEGRFPVGAPMQACNADAAYSPTERCNGGADAGISQGVTSLRLETRTSRRFRYWEPYAGLAFQISYPSSASNNFLPSGNLDGYINTLPPRIGEMTAGVSIVPWEQKARYQRLSIDLRFVGAYVSEGRDYSPLFDALGTSGSPYLTADNHEYPAQGTNPASPRTVHFGGLTDTQSHGRFGFKAGIEMWAARYIRFDLGGSIDWATPYILTFADACNPNFSAAAGDPRIAQCVSGIVNPNHRPVIDLPGNRFRVNGEMTFDLSASAVAQF